ncbi:hypothetical protein KY359_00720 [Candidatus Woesearchaeota archaeon]|nr:hypothetical protein [Candidatus Woesearchaeota archaeon]
MEANTAYDIAKETAREGLDSSTSYFSRPRRHETKDDRQQLVYRIQREIDEQIQPPLKDISYGFAQGLTDMLYTTGEEQDCFSRRDALDYFDRSFMQRELKRVKGNITQYVRDALGAEDEREINNLRRNVYRQIDRYGLDRFIDAARPWKQAPLEDKLGTDYMQPEKVETTLTSVLSGYKSIIQPTVYDDISTRIKEKSPLIAEKISPYMPTPANRLNEIMDTTKGVTNYSEARTIFERQVIYDALDAAGFDKKKAAEYLGDSLRTLNRRIAELGIEEQARKEEREKENPPDNVVRIDEFVQKKLEPDKPPEAVGEIERFHQLVREYNAKRGAERERKDIKKQKQVRLKIAA